MLHPLVDKAEKQFLFVLVVVLVGCTSPISSIRDSRNVATQEKAITFEAYGDSHAWLANPLMVNANVETRGGGHATIYPVVRLNAVARGVSYIRYLGNPSLGNMDSDESSHIN